LISLAGFTRRRRALVAAFLPYLLLSLFVDFVHLHRLILSDMTPVSASQHVKAVETGAPRVPDSPCAICQWLRAGTGLQTSTTTQPRLETIAAAIAPRPSFAPHRPVLGAPDFRGPPLHLAL
jgi:hypothetical protein